MTAGSRNSGTSPMPQPDDPSTTGGRSTSTTSNKNNQQPEMEDRDEAAAELVESQLVDPNRT